MISLFGKRSFATSAVVTAAAAVLLGMSSNVTSFTFLRNEILRRASTSCSARSRRALQEEIARELGVDGIKREAYTPKTKLQKDYFEALRSNAVDVVVCEGPAGTGKTAMACNYAVDATFRAPFVDHDTRRRFRKVVITRPTVAVEEEELGFLPGGLRQKMEPWARPIMDIFEERLSATEVSRRMAANDIELAPLAYMRGRTFKDTLIIADEMQNSTPAQMRMILTRMGTGCKIVVTGDLQQCDLPKKNFQKNGLDDLLDRLHFHAENTGSYDDGSSSSGGSGGSGAGAEADPVAILRFTTDDVVRHPVVTWMLRLYTQPPPPPMGTTIEIDKDFMVILPPAPAPAPIAAPATKNSCEKKLFSSDAAMISKRETDLLQKYLK